MRMKLKKITILMLLVVLFTSVTSCQNTVYKKGVEHPNYDDNYLPIYDGAIVYSYEEEEDEIEISFGSEDDVDDIKDFYQDFFEDEDIILSEEKEDKDEYSAEGQIKDLHFELEIEEPRGDKEDFYKSVTTINIEFNDSDENNEVSEEIAEETLEQPADESKVVGELFETDRFSIVVAEDWEVMEIDGGVQIYKMSGEAVQIYFRGSNMSETEPQVQAESQANQYNGTTPELVERWGKTWWTTLYTAMNMEQLKYLRIENGQLVSVAAAAKDIAGNAEIQGMLESITFK